MVKFRNGRAHIDSRWLGVVVTARELVIANPRFDFERFAFAIQDPADTLALSTCLAKLGPTPITTLSNGSRYAIVPFSFLEKENWLFHHEFGHRHPRRGHPSAWLRIPDNSLSVQLDTLRLEGGPPMTPRLLH